MEPISYRIIVANIDRIAKTKHCISEAFKVGLPISEVSGRLLQPLAEPLSVLCRLSIRVGGHKKHADWLVGALKGEKNTYIWILWTTVLKTIVNLYSTNKIM